MSLKNHLQEKFIYVSDVAEILNLGYTSKKNVFLYGRGGHAKSEIIGEFLKYVDPTGKDTFVQSCGEGLTEDKLFGGINMRKFQRDGEIEHLVENSFMNKKYVVFEELLDSRMNVLLSLKDILTSGYFRQGKQQFKIRTELIICLTNRTKQEVSEDNSIKALLERFPLEAKVEWPEYRACDYSDMFQKVLKKDYPDVAVICNKINETGDFISPRTAIHMAQVYASSGDIMTLRYFGASEEVMEELRKEQERAIQIDHLQKVSDDFIRLSLDVDTDNMASVKNSMKGIKAILSVLESQQYTGDVYSTFTSLRNDINRLSNELKGAALKLFENE